MLLIIGGAYQGKLGFALELTGYKKEDFADGASCEQEAVYTARGIFHFHTYLQRILREKGELDGQAFAEEIWSRNPGLVVVCNELGYGIVPTDPFERSWRETVGRTCTALAGRAKQVYRVICGIGMPLNSAGKEEKILRLGLIRHGKTAGNQKKRYIGITDEALCPEGRQEVLEKRYPPVQAWFTSPMRRCRETLELIAGKKVIYSVVPDFRECDFGRFENRNYQELSDCADYQRWIDSGGTLPFPGGEDPKEFRGRCCRAFEQVVQECFDRGIPAANLVVHGGTIMSILERYGLPERSYYEWQAENGSGYQILIEETVWKKERRVSVEKKL